MLLDRHGLKAYQCNELDSDSPPATGDDAPDLAVWDFSGQELTEFAITEGDADILKRIQSAETFDPDADPPETFEDIDIDNAAIAPDTVRFFDLTGNPDLTIENVSFANIPSRISLILSADSPDSGFQQATYELTEGTVGYVAVAFPDLAIDDDGDDEKDVMTVTISVGGDAADDLNAALEDDTDDLQFGLVTFGDPPQTRTDASSQDATIEARTFLANSDADDIVYYLPIKAEKDNELTSEWDIDLEITVINPAASNAIKNLDLADSVITVLDADAPILDVCDRSDNVVDSIKQEITTGTQIGDDADIFGGHDECDLTLRDLGEIETLTIQNKRAGEPLDDALSAGDLEGLTGLTSLQLVGADALPSGIFAGVGSDGDGVQISFDANSPGDDDDDVPKVGDFTPSTLPTHVFDDQEAKQVIVLSDDLDDEDDPVTNGLDADLYAVTEGGHFFVVTRADTSAWVLGSSVTFATPGLNDGITVTGSNKIVRFAITETDDEKADGDRIEWLFLFKTTNDLAANGVSDLVDLATVAITDAG